MTSTLSKQMLAYIQHNTKFTVAQQLHRAYFSGQWYVNGGTLWTNGTRWGIRRIIVVHCTNASISETFITELHSISSHNKILWCQI